MNMNQITHCIHSITNNACHIFSPHKVRTKATATVQRHQHHQKLATSSLFIPEVESRTQGSRPTPRTQKNPRPRTAFPRTDTLKAKDRNAQGQGQGPRTQAQVLSRKKIKGLHKNFSGDLHKKTFSKKFFKRSTKF